MTKKAPKKSKKLPPEPLTPDEVYQLMGACGHGTCGVRDRAMLIVWWRAGLRCSEALSLQPRDIDRTAEGLVVRVRHGKGNRNRTVALASDAAGYFQAWLAVWKAEFEGSKYIFCNVKARSGKRKGAKLSPITVRSLLMRLRKKAGLEKRVHAHGLRHTFALELDDEGKPLRVIQHALGHANAQTTSTYLSAMGGKEVLGALQSRAMPNPTPPKSSKARARA
jgi:site-specific recombinase XerD